MKNKGQIWLFSVITAIALLLSACNLTANTSAPVVTGMPPTLKAQPTAETSAATATTAAPKAAAPTSAATQPAAAMSSDEAIQTAQTALDALQKAGPRHVSQTTYKGSTAISNIEADAVPPNMHQVISINGQVMAEQYIYNGTIYNQLSGKWTKTTGAAGQFTGVLTDIAGGLKDQIVLSNGQTLGIENVNGKPAAVYSYNSALKGLEDKPTTHKVWVDVATGLPVKQETTNPDGEIIVQLITYDASLTITLPADAAAAPETP